MSSLACFVPRIRTRWRFLPGNSTCGARAIGLPRFTAGGVWNEAFSPFCLGQRVVKHHERNAPLHGFTVVLVVAEGAPSGGDGHAQVEG